MKRKNHTINVSKVLFGILVLSFLIAIIKLSMIALAPKTDGIDLKAFMDNRNTEKETLKANRGTIYSADGEILARSINSYTVIAYLDSSRTKDEAHPHHVVDKEKTAKALSPILKMSEESILALLNQKLYQVELGPGGRGITTNTKLQIEALNLPGIDFIETQKRYYPLGSVASQTIGYAQQDDEDETIVGKMGIEAYLDEELSGTDGYTIYQKDAYGYTMPNTTTVTEPAIPGSDVYLTIDSKIQLFVENGISDITKNNNADWITFTVMDAKTGAIVATSSNLNFNLNTRDNIQSYLDPLQSFQYEPGSTMKIFSFLAAMENGIYDGNATYHSGTIRVDDYTIKDFNGVGWGTITFDSGFSYSSNVAATNLALELGRENLHAYYDSLGFGKKTGIKLPNEGSGDISFKYRVELATASFGQGITTTPVQNLQALSLLANDGIELQPYVVERIVNSETGEVTYAHERTELGRKASQEHTKKMLSLMYDVVYTGKTDATFFKPKTVTMAGKTGTAQIPDSRGRYMNGPYDYIRSFAGVFPYEDPQYIIYVSARRFDGNFYDFAKMVSKVVDEIAKYKNITELVSEVDKTKIIPIENYVSQDVSSIEEKLKKENLDVITIGSGKKVIKQYPPKGQTTLSGNKVFIVTNQNDYKMPDMTGWSYSDATAYCRLVGLKYKTNGFGYVKKQSIEKDSEITESSELELDFE